MGRCNNAEVFKKIGIEKIKPEVEVSFDVHRDLPDCRKINTRDYINSTITAGYNPYNKPENKFECNRPGCVNSGTLIIGASTDKPIYLFRGDATEFSTGILTFYVFANSNTPEAITVELSDSETFTNADSYTVNVTADDVGDDGFAPIVIDLNSTPTAEEGTGWEAGAATYIRLSADKVVGFSSISLYESLEDFEIDSVVKVGCISSMGGSFDISAIESTCLSHGYDTSLSSLSFPVTGNTVTPNYHLLNPLNGKGEAEEGFEIVTVRKTVKENTVTIADMFLEECGNVAVQVPDDCGDPELKRISMPVPISVDEGHFQMINNNDGTVTFRFHNILNDKDVLISYPKTIQVEEWVGNVDNLDSVRVRMTVPLKTTDGRSEIHVFNNVLVTGFPMSFTREETEFAFTITIQKDSGGDFYHIYKQIA